MLLLKKYFYRLLYRYLSLYVRPEDTVVEINHPFINSKTLALKSELCSEIFSRPIESTADYRNLKDIKPEYIILNGTIHYERDIDALFKKIHRNSASSTRVLITYYSSLWKPALKLATLCGFRDKTAEQNWIAPEDIENILALSNFELLFDEGKIICPVYIPVISTILNRYVAPLPVFRAFCLLHILAARPLMPGGTAKPSVTVVVPARNESANIENVIKRLPAMGPDDELIFVEGHSSDDTWKMIQEMQRKYSATRNIVIAQQEGTGKGDAVRKGFDLASKDILMILDADLTVPPESLPLFYDAITENKGEFINGSRLVYPMEDKAMRFFNMVGNKFFARAFSYVLNQKFKDTLCGTKVVSRENYRKIAAHRNFFGEFDPFGDFDLIFGAIRLGLKIREIPVRYRERTYGSTNINRWRDGAALFRMLLYAARKIKFV